MRRVFALACALLIAVPALAADRDEAEAAMRRAVTAFNAGQHRAASVAMREAIQADPGWGLAHAIQARIFLSLGDGEGARAELDRAQAGGVPVAQTRHLRAEAALLAGDADRALAEASAADIPVRHAAHALRVQGMALTAQENFPAAEAAFDRSLAIAPNSAPTWVEIGRFRMAAADQAGAVAAADRAVTLDSTSGDALVLKGILVRGQYGLVAAMPWFDRALEIDGQHVDALLEAAATLGDLGRMREMLAMTRRALALDGRNGRAWYLQAVLAARAGDYPLARSLIGRAGDGVDAMPGPALLKATLEIEQGAFAQAIARLERLLSFQPDNSRVRRLLGTALFRSGDADGAVAALRPIADRPDADSYTLSLAGRALETLGDRQAAAAYLDRAAWPGRGAAVAFGTGEDLAMLNRDALVDSGAGARVRLIRGLLIAGNGQGALNEATSLRRAHPGTPAAHLLVGDALAALGRPMDAVEAYRAAANISFSEPVALRIIDAADRAGRGDIAVQTLRLFLAQNPVNVSALLLASEYFQRAQQWPQSIRVLEGLRARLGDGDALILNNLAWAYYRNGEGDTALPYAARAYRLSPSNPVLAESYGWFLVETGRNAAVGVQLLEKASAIAPDAPRIRNHLARAYAKAGKPQALAAR